MSKKVILISGSPREKGNTMAVMNECKAVLEEHGVKAEVISLAEKEVRACVACYKCQKKKRCVLKDDFEDIADKVLASDGFIIGSPVYYGTARGDVLNFLQRLGMVNGSRGRPLSGKVGGPIAVARRGGHTQTLQEMMMFFEISDMVVPGSTYWNMVIARNPGEAKKDKEGWETIRHFAKNVAKLVKKL